MARRSHLDPKLETTLIIAVVASAALFYLPGSWLTDSQLAVGPLFVVAGIAAVAALGAGAYLGRSGGIKGMWEAGWMLTTVALLIVPAVFSLANQVFDTSVAVPHAITVTELRTPRKRPNYIVFTSPDYPGTSMELMARRAPGCVAGSIGTVLVRRGAFGFAWVSSLTCTARREP